MTEKTLNRLNTLITTIFYLLGGRFYMDWILITNDKSKNLFLRKFWEYMGVEYFKNVGNRFMLSIMLFTIHFVYNGFFVWAHITHGVDWVNIVINLLVNVYPMLVQIYIGFRCYRVIQHKNSLSQ